MALLKGHWTSQNKYNHYKHLKEKGVGVLRGRETQSKKNRIEQVTAVWGGLTQV